MDMELAKDLAQDYLEERYGDKSNNLSDEINQLLVNEIQIRGLWIPEETLNALELLNGGEPVHTRECQNAINRRAFEMLDEVVENGGNVGDGLQGFDLAQVSVAERLTSNQGIEQYARQIRKAHQLLKSVGEMCDDNRLAGSILRLLAIRASRRVELVNLELTKTANLESTDRPRANIRKELKESTDLYLGHIDSFLTQFDHGQWKMPAPSVLAPKYPAVSQTGNSTSHWAVVCICVFLLVTVFSGVYHIANKVSNPNRSDRPSVKEFTRVDPMAADRAVKKWSVIAALRSWVEEKKKLPKLWDAIQVLRKGALENDTHFFTEAQELLNHAYVEQSKIEDYGALRMKTLQNAQILKKSSQLEKANYDDFAKWFMGLPHSQEAPEINPLAREELLRIEIELGNQRNSEMKKLNDLLKHLSDAKDGPE